MIVVDGRGRTRARMSAEMFGGDRFLADIEITRGDLIQVLLDEIGSLPTESGTLDYRYSEWVEDLSQDDNVVNVRFASGDVGSFDFIIGADGLHSTLREQIFGPHQQFTEYLGAYVGFFTMQAPQGSELQTSWGGVYPVPGSAVGLRPDRDPANSTAIITARMPANDKLRGDVAGQQQLIRDRLAGHGWVVPSVLDAMAEAPDFYFDEVTRVKMPVWSRGRVVLIGDAAYCGSPMTGMGTTLALMGAYLLAGEITSTPDDLERAFNRYESLLRPLVTEVQRGTALTVRTLLPRTRRGLALRLTLLGIVVSRPLRPVRALFTRMSSKMDEFQLPDYPDRVPTV